jgi:leucyl-tRNA synthetase
VVDADSDEEALRRAALENEKARATIAGRPVHDVIVVRGRLANVVTA